MTQGVPQCPRCGQGAQVAIVGIFRLNSRCMKKAAAVDGRSGVSMRIGITPAEYRQLRILAAERETTVPRLIAELIREALKKRKP